MNPVPASLTVGSAFANVVPVPVWCGSQIRKFVTDNSAVLLLVMIFLTYSADSLHSLVIKDWLYNCCGLNIESLLCCWPLDCCALLLPSTTVRLATIIKSCCTQGPCIEHPGFDLLLYLMPIAIMCPRHL